MQHDLLASSLDGNQVAIVGVGGIGAQCAMIASQLGAALTLADIRTPAELAGKLVEESGRAVSAVELEISSRAAIDEFCAAHAELDALIVTSAILPEVAQKTGSPEWRETFEDVLRTNVIGPLQLAQTVAERMIERGTGRIVLFGSLGGRNGGLRSGLHYIASKGAIHSGVKWLSQKTAPHGVCVNGLAPGATATPMLEGKFVDVSRIPIGRLADPVEIARMAVFLASPAASYIHGAMIDVNGGAYLS